MQAVSSSRSLEFIFRFVLQNAFRLHEKIFFKKCFWRLLQAATAMSSCSCWRATRTWGRTRESCSCSAWLTRCSPMTPRPCARTSGTPIKISYSISYRLQLHTVAEKSLISLCCPSQHPALRSDPSVHQLGPDWMGAPLWHAACPHQRLQREEEDSAQHRASHHAQGGEHFLFVSSLLHRGTTSLICMHARLLISIS